MKLLVGLGLLGCVMAAGLPAHAAEPDQESAQIMCDLTGDCAEPAADGAKPAGEAAPATPHARTSATRGFTFSRTTAPTATTAAAIPMARPALPGAADLKLSFMPGSAILTEPAKARLAKFASVLGNPRLSARRLRIEGYTDANGNAKANLDLSRRRAQAVADYLASSGVAKTRLDVVGYGSGKPLPGVGAGAPENRRVMAVLL